MALAKALLPLRFCKVIRFPIVDLEGPQGFLDNRIKLMAPEKPPRSKVWVVIDGQDIRILKHQIEPVLRYDAHLSNLDSKNRVKVQEFSIPIDLVGEIDGTV